MKYISILLLLSGCSTPTTYKKVLKVVSAVSGCNAINVCNVVYDDGSKGTLEDPKPGTGILVCIDRVTLKEIACP